MTYPDLAFRGRPLLPDKPHRANNSRSYRKAVHTASTNNYSDDSKAADLPRANCIKDIKPATTSICSKTDDSKAAEMFGDDGRGSRCNDRNTDGSRVGEDLSHPQAVSLHITLRAGPTTAQRLKPGEPQPKAEPPVCTQQQTPAGNTPGIHRLSAWSIIRSDILHFSDYQYWCFAGFFCPVADNINLLKRALLCAVMQPPVSVCSHHPVVSLSVPPTTLSDWWDVTTNSLSALSNLRLQSN